VVSIGDTATIDAFVQKVRAQDRYSWDPKFTGDVVNSWIRSGFFTTNSTTKCNDTIDNDGDRAIDYPNDAGCIDANDDDETDCGNSICEIGETSSSCPADCKTTSTCGPADENSDGIVST